MQFSLISAARQLGLKKFPQLGRRSELRSGASTLTAEVNALERLQIVRRLRIGSKLSCIRSTPAEMQSISENDFECFASTGVNAPGTMFSTVELPGQALSCRMKQVGPYLSQFFFSAVNSASLSLGAIPKHRSNARRKLSPSLNSGRPECRGAQA